MNTFLGAFGPVGMQAAQREVQMRDESYRKSLWAKHFGSKWRDMRSEASGNAKAGSSRGRTMTQINGLVLHCTGYMHQRTAEGWADHLGVHYGIQADGTILMLFDESARRPASGGFNTETVAVEFIGNFEKTETDTWRDPPKHQAHEEGVLPKSLKEHRREAKAAGKKYKANGCTTGHHDRPSVAQIETGRNLVRYLRELVDLQFVYAHRQSSPKADCPGKHVWYNVGQWALNQGLLTDSRQVTTFTKKDDKKLWGSAIPDEWNDPELSIC